MTMRGDHQMRIAAAAMRSPRCAGPAAGLAGALLFAACAPAAQQAPVAPPDRSVRPAIAEVPDLELPAAQRFTLSNGLPVVLLEKHDIPLVQTSLLVRSGAIDEPANREGLAALVADMLEQGAGGRSALELSDALDFLGARFSSGAGVHSTTIGLRVPVARWADGLALMSDMVVRPEFPAPELERLRLARLTSLIRAHDSPGTVAATLFDRTLFGPEHPYGRSGLVEASLRAATVADIRAFHERFYRPDRATLVVVGAVDAATARARLESAFGGWRAAGTAPAAARPAEPAQVQGRTIYLVDNPGAAQSFIRMGRIGVPRNSDDYYALQVMNTILGGSFTSRLNQNLREDKGYAYGASSSFAFRPFAGPFFAAASVQTDKTGPSLHEFMVELRAIRETVNDEEVALARNFLASRFPGGFQSVAEIAGQMSELVLYDLPHDYYNHFVDRVLAVTRADVERVARRYVDPENIAIVVVGDRSVVEEQIRALGLGPLQILEIGDVLGAVPVIAGR
jgi:zinc protease